MRKLTSKRVPKFHFGVCWALIQHSMKTEFSHCFLTLIVSRGPLFNYIALKVGEAQLMKLLASPKNINKIKSLKLMLFAQMSVPAVIA